MPFARTPAYGSNSFSATQSASVDFGSNANRGLLGFIFFDNNFNPAVPTLTSVVIDPGGAAVSCTLGARRSGSIVLGPQGYCYAFWASGASVPTGVKTVTATANDGNGKPRMWCVPIDDATAISAEAVSTGLSLAPSVTVSSAASRVVFGLLAAYILDSQTVTPTAPATQVSRVLEAAAAGLAGAIWQEAGAASVTIDGAYTGSTAPWAMTAWSVTGASDTTPPIITGPAGATGATSAISLAENITAVHTFTANESVTWSINGGADAARFTIGSGTGALVFATAPNFEAPTDADTNNTYIVGVRATDTAGNPTTQTCTVTVVNANEAPTFAGPSVANLSGTVGDAINVTDLATRFTDPDSGDTGTYTTGGSWPTGPVLTSAGVLQGVFPAAGTYGSLTVIRTDASSLTATSNAFSITASAPVTPTATLNGALDSITGNLSATAVQGRLTSALPLRDAARVVLANRSDVAVHVQAIATLTSIALLSAQSITSGIWTAVGPFVPGTTYAVTYGVGGTRIGCEIITATAP